MIKFIKKISSPIAKDDFVDDRPHYNYLKYFMKESELIGQPLI